MEKQPYTIDHSDPNKKTGRLQRIEVTEKNDKPVNIVAVVGETVISMCENRHISYCREFIVPENHHVIEDIE